MKRYFVGLLALCCGAAATALTYHPRMDQALWQTDASALRCQLVQPIPDFGRAVFEREAGGGLRFYLHSAGNPMDQGQAALSSQAPRWNPDLFTEQLGLVTVSSGARPVELEAELATRLLSELYKGMSPRFLRRSWYAEAEAIEVGLSSVTFRAAYAEYQRCLAELAPVGFAQLARSRVHFETDKTELTSKTVQWLNIMADYLARASDVERVFIDGHTDDTHTANYNVELSRKRAEAVAEYLVGKGISRNQLTVRYHGERFPVKPNSSGAGKAYNRRVTLRVQVAGAAIASR